MKRPLRIALDAMGGDHGPAVVVPAVAQVAREYSDLSLILVGDVALVRAELARHQLQENDRLVVHHASEVVGMDEAPSKALRGKKDSSMRVAINLVKAGQADAVVSAGNTGALMAIARFVLKTIPGIDRPAIMSRMPTVRGHTYMLDLGANAGCTPDNLYQFAVMGAAMVGAVHGIERPTVALLNIGEEELKGIEPIKKAALLLQKSRLNYIGFIEGNHIFDNRANVVVCDGFVGNVALKTSEGVAKLIGHFMREEFTRAWYAKLAAMAAYPVLKALRKRMDPRLYNGASLLGLQGIVIKSHGGADSVAFANAIKIGILEIRENIPAKIADLVATSLWQASQETVLDISEG
jgi:glycerol-3-phosphate acyltransferase PlsX